MPLADESRSASASAETDCASLFCCFSRYFLSALSHKASRSFSLAAFCSSLSSSSGMSILLPNAFDFLTLNSFSCVSNASSQSVLPPAFLLSLSLLTSGPYFHYASFCSWIFRYLLSQSRISQPLSLQSVTTSAFSLSLSH